MRRNAIHCVLVTSCLAATAQALVILPTATPKPPVPPPDVSTVVVSLDPIQLDPQEVAVFACPDDPAWACIGSVQLDGQLPKWSSAGASVWLDCLDSQGQTIPLGQQIVIPRNFVYQQQAPSWADGVALCIRNLADRQVVITNANLTITYAPDPSTVVLLMLGAGMLLVRRRR